MIKTIEITCASCGKKIEKKLAEINRQKKKGKTKFYCNKSCSGKDHVSHLAQYKNYFIDNKHIRQPDKYTNFRWYIKNVIKNSKERNQESDIDLAYLLELWDEQNGICPFTKQKLELRTLNYKNSSQPYSASLDRIDNAKGYIKGNVRFVSLIFNYARNTFSDQQVIEFCKQVANQKL